MNFKQALTNLLLLIVFVGFYVVKFEDPYVEYACDDPYGNVHAYLVQGDQVKDIIVPFGTELGDYLEKQGLNHKNFSLPLESIIYDNQEIVVSETNELSVDSINTMSFDELVQLNGVGPKTAENILDYIGKYGPFLEKEEMLLVSGIGPVKLKTIFHKSH